MARYAPLWLQGASYSAQVDRQLYAALFPAGGASGPPVTAQANTLNVNAPAGRCVVPMTTDGSAALCRWDATEVVAVNAGPAAGTSRLDLIVATVRDASNDFIIQVLSGQAAASPVPPNLLANSYALCSILVPPTVANLNTATITDLRSGLGVPRQRQFELAADTDVTTTALRGRARRHVYAGRLAGPRRPAGATGFIAGGGQPAHDVSSLERVGDEIPLRSVLAGVAERGDGRRRFGSVRRADAGHVLYVHASDFGVDRDDMAHALRVAAGARKLPADRGRRLTEGRTL